MFDGKVLDHANRPVVLVDGQLDPQPPIPHRAVPASFVVAGLLHLIGPVLETHQVGIFILRREIHDLQLHLRHGSKLHPPGRGHQQKDLRPTSVLKRIVG